MARAIRQQRDEQVDARVLPIGINPDIEIASIPTAGAWARWTSVVVGAWMVVASFAFPRSSDSRANAWIVGLAIVTLALAARTVSGLRWLCVAAAVWLGYSALAMFDSAPSARWNDSIAALIVFVASLVPTRLRYARYV